MNCNSARQEVEGRAREHSGSLLKRANERGSGGVYTLLDRRDPSSNLTGALSSPYQLAAPWRPTVVDTESGDRLQSAGSDGDGE
jgi:hypothetical protein